MSRRLRRLRGQARADSSDQRAARVDLGQGANMYHFILHALSIQYKLGLEEPDLGEKFDLKHKDPLTTQRYLEENDLEDKKVNIFCRKLTILE